jgi:hypothetical protein
MPRDEVAHPQIDLIEQPAAGGIKRIVEVEHPVGDRGQGAARRPGQRSIYLVVRRIILIVHELGGELRGLT